MNQSLPPDRYAIAPGLLERVDSKSARIYCVIARSAPEAVVFRRGPGNLTRLLRWNLKSDTVEPGQWIKARIYERRCDLSPDGKFLVYFAANHRPPLGSWTAISRPPYFTALALWEKGDCWGGGGLFDTSIRLRLNHRAQIYRDGIDEMKLQEGFRRPKQLLVEPMGETSGWGEDDPIMTNRLSRDGWTFDHRFTERREHGRSERFWITFDPPLTSLKKISGRRKDRLLTLRVHLHAIQERQARWYVESADIVDQNSSIVRKIGRVDWTDIDGNGDVLYAAEGRLYRLVVSRNASIEASVEPTLVADLNAMQFEPIRPPAWALKWR